MLRFAVDMCMKRPHLSDVKGEALTNHPYELDIKHLISSGGGRGQE